MNGIKLSIPHSKDPRCDIRGWTVSSKGNLPRFCLNASKQGLGKTRCSILSEQLKKHGAQVTRSLEAKTEYLLVSKDIKFERLLKILKCKQIPLNVSVINVDWLSACLVSGKLEDPKRYQLFTHQSSENDKIGGIGLSMVSPIGHSD